MSQINSSDLFIAQDGIGIAFSNDAAIVNNICLVADIQSLSHVVVGDQHADTSIREMTNYVFNVIDGDRVHTCKWLVQQDEVRIGGQGSGYFNAPTLSPR